MKQESNGFNYGQAIILISSLYAVKDVTVGGTDYYKLLIKHEDIFKQQLTSGKQLTLLNNNENDWSTTNWYTDPKN